MKLNFDDVQSGEAVPVGFYEAHVFEVVLKHAQSSGKPYFNWEFKLTGGDYDGRKLYDITSLQPQALFRLKAHLEALGYEMPEGGDFDFDPKEVVGMACIVHVHHEEYQGEMRAKVKKILSSSSPDINLGPSEAQTSAPKKGLGSKGKVKAAASKKKKGILGG